MGTQDEYRMEVAVRSPRRSDGSHRMIKESSIDSHHHRWSRSRYLFFMAIPISGITHDHFTGPGRAQPFHLFTLVYIRLATAS